MNGLRGWGVLAVLVLALLPAFRDAARAEGVPETGPLIAPEEMLSVEQVRPGMTGYGKSVFTGTKIERFNVTVVGVLRKIDFGGDMILVRIDDGPPVATGSGVSAGMSGSPIYVDGKLIGALAFAWPFAKEPVAGVTPIAQMLENYRPGSAPPSVALSGNLKPEGGPLALDGKLFARATVVPDRGFAPAASAGTLYLTPVATPLMVSGMGRPGLDGLRKRFERYGAFVAPGPGAADLPPAERPKIEPGSAVGVQLLGGDIDATAIGTVTYVKGDHVLGFGHPFFGLGSIDMPMTTAYIHGIISSQEVSFKMGSPVEAVGRVSQDRNWSIGGRMDRVPRTVRAEFAISDTDRGVKRDYAVSAAVHRDLTPSLLYSAMLSAVGSVSPPTSGTTRGVVEVWAKGLPTVRRENVFAVGQRRSALEELFGDPFAGMPLVELLQIMQVLENNPFGPVPVERVRVTVDLTERRRTAAIERAYADRKRVKPGETVKIGVVLRPVDGQRETREFEVAIPRNIPGGRLLIGVAGGSTSERVRQMMQITRPPAKTVEQLVGQIAEREQNSDLSLQIAPPVAGVTVSGREFPNLPNVVVEVLTGANPSGIRMVRTHTRQAYATPYVLSGGQILTLQVEADEKDKAGASPTPGGGTLGGLGSLLDLFRFGSGGDLGGEDSLLGEEGDAGDLARLARAMQAAGLLDGPARPLADLPTEPAMPSFEELQRILEGDEDLASGGEGGEDTPQNKGIARGPGVWRMRAANDFRKGKLEGVLVSSRGEIALAPEPAPLLASPDRFFWAQAADPQGNVYAGGWLEGSIVRIDPSGRQSLFFEGKGEVAIAAMTCGADGALYAAAEPSGTIYRIESSGQAAPLCRLPGERVWALARVGEDLYAGTGSEGKLYRIGKDGKAECVFTAPDRHLFALAADGNGTLYLGTYPRGKVFRLRGGPGQVVEPLHELPAAAVTALACDREGNLYVGTSPKASVVRITPAGDATTLFQVREKHLFSLLVDREGNVFAGAGSPARLYRIAPDRTVSTLWEPQAAYVLSLSHDRDGNLFATTAGPTQVVRLGARPGTRGTYTSAVLNAGNLARWGTVRWSGPTSGIAVETRSGNTVWPDETWSGWSKPYTRAAGEPVVSPPGHYLQYRVVLQAAEGTPAPVLRSLELFYRPRNRAPEVAVRNPVPGEVLSATRTIRWSGRDPDADRLDYEVFYQQEGSDAWVRIGSRSTPAEEHGEPEAEEARAPLGPRAAAARPAPAGGAVPPRHVLRPAAAPARRAAAPRAPARRPAQTSLTLPSGAEAEAEPEIPTGKEDASDGEQAEEDPFADGPSLTWNTKTVKDGRYRIKIAATDRLTSPDEPLTAETVSDYVLIDNTAPRAQPALARRTGLAPPAEVPVKDEGTYVASAEYRVDGGPWMGAAAADGIFDSPEEAVRIDPAALKPGRRTLELRVRDAAGNEAVSRIPYVLGPVPPEVAPPAPSAPPKPATKPRPAGRKVPVRRRR